MYEMVQVYHDGCVIIYGVRNDRPSNSFFKRNMAQSFYKVLNMHGGALRLSAHSSSGLQVKLSPVGRAHLSEQL